MMYAKSFRVLCQPGNVRHAGGSHSVIHLTRTTKPATFSLRSFSSTTRTASAEHAGSEDHYDPPSGWLWGIKPGDKYEKEGWENIWIYGFFGSLGLGVVAWCFKTDSSIQTWALEEARRRLEAEGILKEPQGRL